MVIETVQVRAVPVQAPVHWTKREPVAGRAVRVTEAAGMKRAEQVAPQLMPDGLETTDPTPVPERETVRSGFTRKVAVTVLAAVIDTVQVLAVPVQAPDHLSKMDPAAGDAVSVTVVPFAKVAVQVGPHVMPAGEDLTVPGPPPLRETVS